MRVPLMLSILFWVINPSYGQKANAVRNANLPNYNPAIPNPMSSLFNSSQNIEQMNRQTIEQDMRNYELQRQRDETLEDAYRELGIGDKITGNSFPSIDYSYPPNIVLII